MNPITVVPFNHQRHIGNTIAKRQRELAEVLEAIDQLPKGSGKTKLRAEAWEIFYDAMTEIEQRIRKTS